MIGRYSLIPIQYNVYVIVFAKFAIPISDDGAREDVAALPAMMFVHDHRQD